MANVVIVRDKYGNPVVVSGTTTGTHYKGKVRPAGAGGGAVAAQGETTEAARKRYLEEQKAAQAAREFKIYEKLPSIQAALAKAVNKARITDINRDVSIPTKIKTASGTFTITQRPQLSEGLQRQQMIISIQRKQQQERYRQARITETQTKQQATRQPSQHVSATLAQSQPSIVFGEIRERTPTKFSLGNIPILFREQSERASFAAQRDKGLSRQLRSYESLLFGVAAGFTQPFLRPKETVVGTLQAVTRPREAGAQIGAELERNPAGFIGEQIGFSAFFSGAARAFKPTSVRVLEKAAKTPPEVIEAPVYSVQKPTGFGTVTDVSVSTPSGGVLIPNKYLESIYAIEAPARTVTQYAGRGVTGLIESTGRVTETRIVKYAGKKYYLRTSVSPTGQATTKVFNAADKLLTSVEYPAQPSIAFTEPRPSMFTREFMRAPDITLEQTGRLYTQKGIPLTQPSRFKSAFVTTGAGTIYTGQRLAAATLQPSRYAALYKPFEVTLPEGTIKPSSASIILGRTKYKFASYPKKAPAYEYIETPEGVFEYRPARTIVGERITVQARYRLVTRKQPSLFTQALKAKTTALFRSKKGMLRSIPVLEKEIRRSQIDLTGFTGIKFYDLTPKPKTSLKTIPVLGITPTFRTEIRASTATLQKSSTAFITKLGEKPKLASLPMILTKTSPDILQDVKPEVVQLLKPAVRMKPALREQQKVQAKQETKTQTKQLTKTLTRTLPRSRLTPKVQPKPQPRPRPKFIPKPTEEKTTKKKSVALGVEQAFAVFLKRHGQFFKIGVAATRKGALDIGTRAAVQTLGATFRIAKTTQKPTVTKTRGEYVSYQRLFRTYAIRQGRKIPLAGTFIQKKGARLTTRSERKEIQKARKKTSWF